MKNKQMIKEYKTAVKSYKVVAKNILGAKSAAIKKAPVGYNKVISVKQIKVYPDYKTKEYLVSVMKSLPSKPTVVYMSKKKGTRMKKMKY